MSTFEKEKIVTHLPELEKAKIALTEAFCRQDRFTSHEVEKVVNDIVAAVEKIRGGEKAREQIIVALLDDCFNKQAFTDLGYKADLIDYGDGEGARYMLAPSRAMWKSMEEEGALTGIEPRGFSISIFKKDIEPFQQRIRKAIQDKLKEHEIEKVHIAPKLKGGRVAFLDSDAVFKASISQLSLTSEKSRQAAMRAIERLYTLEERSEFILYPGVTIDPDTGLQIQKKLSFIPLSEWVLQQPKPMLQAALMRVTDVVQGLMFLRDHGLRLMDIDLKNIAVRLDTGKGALFDYDGLRESDIEIQEYLMKPGWCPPERQVDSASENSPLTDNDAVFELGKTVEAALEMYKAEKMDDVDLVALRLLMVKMLGDRPRPSLDEVKKELEAITKVVFIEETAPQAPSIPSAQELQEPPKKNRLQRFLSLFAFGRKKEGT